MLCCSECKLYNEALAEHTAALELSKQQGQSVAVQDNIQVRLDPISMHCNTVILPCTPTQQSEQLCDSPANTMSPAFA